MMNLLYIFLVVLFLKVTVNASKYIQCKRYLEKYLDWIEKPDWNLIEHKSKVINLFQGAGVPDSFAGVVEPMGFGQIRTANVSVMANFPNQREDFFFSTRAMFHQAIGVYRSRMIEAINPLYWIEFIINLPRQVLGYLGVAPESLVTKISQLIYWVIAAIFTFTFALYRSNIEQLVRDWLSKIVP